MRRFVLVCLGLVASAFPAADGDFAPVSTPAGLQAAFRAQFKVLQSWLDQDDFDSAREAARGLPLLCQLYDSHGDSPRWRELTGRVRRAASDFESACRRKSAADCKRALQEMRDRVQQLDREMPVRSPAWKAARPTGPVKEWMHLMEGAYTDAKTTQDPAELSVLAEALAEEANAVSHLRADAAWRQMAADVRQAALRASATARGTEVDKAKEALKMVYQRCEACHNRARP